MQRFKENISSHGVTGRHWRWLIGKQETLHLTDFISIGGCFLIYNKNQLKRWHFNHTSVIVKWMVNEGTLEHEGKMPTYYKRYVYVENKVYVKPTNTELTLQEPCRCLIQTRAIRNYARPCISTFILLALYLWKMWLVGSIVCST